MHGSLPSKYNPVNIYLAREVVSKNKWQIVFWGNVRANERGNFPWFPRSFAFRSRAKTSLFQTIKVKY